MLCLRAIQTCISVCQPLGALVARRQVIDPPAWCGAAIKYLCWGRGDPYPLLRTSLVESGTKVPGTWQALVASQGVLERDLVAEKRHS